MSCYRCGARQIDPVRGESPWKRGVRANRQVLICPDCQSSSDWTAELDRCEACGSAHLVRRLGEVECRDCGSAGGAAPDGGPAPGQAGEAAPGLAGDVTPELAGDVTPGLAEEVELALARVLGRAGKPGWPARIG